MTNVNSDFIVELKRVGLLADAMTNITIATNMGQETIGVTNAEAQEYQRDPYGFGAHYFGFRNRNEYGMWIGKVKPGFGVGFIAIGKLGDP